MSDFYSERFLESFGPYIEQGWVFCSIRKGFQILPQPDRDCTIASCPLAEKVHRHQATAEDLKYTVQVFADWLALKLSGALPGHSQTISRPHVSAFIGFNRVLTRAGNFKIRGAQTSTALVFVTAGSTPVPCIKYTVSSFCCLVRVSVDKADDKASRQ